jgi:hypothetical protein
LGRFLDAYNAGVQARQSRVEAEHRKAEAERKKAHDDLAAANKWLSDVLAPVTMDLRTDLKPVGQVTIEQISRPLQVGSVITIALQGYEPTKLSFHVKTIGGLVSICRGAEDGKPLGTIAVVSRHIIENLFCETIESIGEA